MWTPKKITSKTEIIDFTSSGQGVVDVTAIYIDNDILSNACERVDLTQDPYQFIVCNSCGYTQCASGGWLSIGKLVDTVFFYPAFTTMQEGEWEYNEYTPPSFIAKKGILYISRNNYKTIQASLKYLPSFDKLKRLTSNEIAYILQWEAPYQVLGEYPQAIELNHNNFITSSAVDDEELLLDFQSLLSKLTEPIEFDITTITLDMEKISIFLETSEFIEWVPLVKYKNRYGIIINEVLAVFEKETR